MPPESDTEPEAKANPRFIDLDAAKARRAEAAGDPVTVLWQGEAYELPAELPARFLDYIAADDFVPAFRSLFPASLDVDEFVDSASYEDLMELADGIARAYGLGGDGGLGNLRRSGASSTNTSRR